MSWLRFNDELEFNRCMQEIADRLGLNGNVTLTYAKAKIDADGKYVAPKPKQSVIDKIEYLVRPKTIESTDEEGNPVQVDTIEKVQKQYDEQDNDITVYEGTEYVLTKQTDLSSMFVYEEVESVQFPVIESEV